LAWFGLFIALSFKYFGYYLAGCSGRRDQSTALAGLA